MKIQNSFQMLRSIIHFTINHQDENRSQKKSLSLKAWHKEYCTIKLYLPRRSGNTEAIKKMVKFIDRFELLHDPKCIVLCPNVCIGQSNYEYGKWKVLSPSKDLVTNEIEVSKHDLHDKEFVFVDNYYRASKAQEERLYNNLTDKTQIIALIQ